MTTNKTPDSTLKPCPCRKCGTNYVRPPHQIRSSHYICPTCMKVKDKKRRLTEARREYMRKYKKKYHATKTEKTKERCRAKTRKAVASGVLKKESCEVCESPTSQAHHEDYNDPFTVRWFCDQHHKDLHNHRHQTESENE